jgi:hypothetical protein
MIQKMNLVEILGLWYMMRWRKPIVNILPRRKKVLSALLYLSCVILTCFLFRLSHVQVDILRLLPYSESAEYRIPPKIISKRISPQITMSVYNIPNGPDDLKFAMRNLSQLYYNINVLHISNIPMKSAENTQSTQTVTLYYQANGYHLINQQEPFKTSHIHDPKYLKNRELKLIYSKRSKRALPGK